MNNYQTAKDWALKLGKLPGVAAVFLSGSLAQGRGNANSDIDFFIIAKPGQIWTARFWVFIRLKFTGRLAKPHHHAGHVCPNHFITTDRLEIQEKDAYSAHLFSHNQPLYDPHNVFPRFVAANQWVQDFDEDFDHKFFVSSVGAENFPPVGRYHRPLQKLLETILKNLQSHRIKRNPEYKIPGAKIVLTDQELRFHPKPRNKNWSK